MLRLDIDRLLDEVGETITVTDTYTGATYNDRGDITEGSTQYQITAIVQVLDGSEDMVKEGYLEGGDIVIFISSTDQNISVVERGNRVTWNSENYRIVNVIKNEGHYEVHCKKI